jgi:uncharacterized repeat protein (TIGR03803 family)
VLSNKTFATVHELVLADGANPLGKLVRSNSGLLYGTTFAAGPNGAGTVFSLDPASNAFAVLHGFDDGVHGGGSDADLTIKGGFIYGTTRGGGAKGDGTIFKLDPATGKLTTLYGFTGHADGHSPAYGVVQGQSGHLYGATAQGGGSGAGVVFQFKPGTLGFKTIHDFSIGDGSIPSGPLLYANGALYGVTSGGNGTVFKIVP